MGVVNVTPDSFSDGGRFADVDAAAAHAEQLVADGADLIDLGGESSRPGAAPVPESVELERVLSVLERLRRRVDVPISIDTTKSGVAERALDLGADVINDISGLRFDARMPELLVARDCGVIVMHMQGEPRTMQDAPQYADVVSDVRAWLDTRVRELGKLGIAADRLVVDPGIGFGKRFEDNLALLRDPGALRVRDLPLLVGASRKRFLGQLLDEPDPGLRLEGDLAVAAHCRAAGVDILRVHDVRAVRRLFRVLGALTG
jgi:dihydropteroate synthase